MFSPFRYNDLNLNSTSGFLKDSTDGYLLLSWLKVDADNIQTIKKEGEGYFVNMEIACMTSSIGDEEQETKLMKYEFRIKEENLAWVKKNGVRFALQYPVRKPGAYYFRIAVKDQLSGKIGSVYQFIEIPDLKKGDFALSNLFPIRTEDDATWISDAYKELTKDCIYPLLNRNEKKIPELRNYQPGDSIEYMAIIYNANHGGIIPELESQVNLYRDQIIVMKGEPLKLNVNHQSDYSQIPIRRRLILGKEMPEGNYTLQLLVKDKQSRKDGSMAIQTLNFEIKKRLL
jgi:hypothetical protein